MSDYGEILQCMAVAFILVDRLVELNAPLIQIQLVPDIGPLYSSLSVGNCQFASSFSSTCHMPFCIPLKNEWTACCIIDDDVKSLKSDDPKYGPECHSSSPRDEGSGRYSAGLSRTIILNPDHL